MRKKYLKILIPVAVLILAAGGYWYRAPLLQLITGQKQTPQTVTTSPALPIENLGLIITDPTEGDGAEVNQDNRNSVLVTYTGSYGDGTLFDSAHADTPVLVSPSKPDAPLGWKRGLVGMKVGGSRVITILPVFAERAQHPEIPKDALVIYQINLHGILEIQEGDVHDRPPPGIPLVQPNLPQ